VSLTRCRDARGNSGASCQCNHGYETAAGQHQEDRPPILDPN